MELGQLAQGDPKECQSLLESLLWDHRPLRNSAIRRIQEEKRGFVPGTRAAEDRLYRVHEGILQALSMPAIFGAGPGCLSLCALTLSRTRDPRPAAVD